MADKVANFFFISMCTCSGLKKIEQFMCSQEKTTNFKKTEAATETVFENICSFLPGTTFL